MPRNLERRVEVTVPVLDPTLCARLDEILQTELEDDVLAWDLGSEGAWTKCETERGLNAQERLMQFAVERQGNHR
jgi:polyphosphate kinase